MQAVAQLIIREDVGDTVRLNGGCFREIRGGTWRILGCAIDESRSAELADKRAIQLVMEDLIALTRRAARAAPEFAAIDEENISADNVMVAPRMITIGVKIPAPIKGPCWRVRPFPRTSSDCA